MARLRWVQFSRASSGGRCHSCCFLSNGFRSFRRFSIRFDYKYWVVERVCVCVRMRWCVVCVCSPGGEFAAANPSLGGRPRPRSSVTACHVVCISVSATFGSAAPQGLAAVGRYVARAGARPHRPGNDSGMESRVSRETQDASVRTLILSRLLGPHDPGCPSVARLVRFSRLVFVTRLREGTRYSVTLHSSFCLDVST